jgi:hypothetical protein
MYFHHQGFKKGSTDNNLYINTEGNILLIIVVCVDDIIFGSNIELMSKKFEVAMQQEFEMSMLGEISFFLSLQIHQSKKGNFISQGKYLKKILNKFFMENCTSVCTPMTTNCKINKDYDALEVDQTMYRSMIIILLYLIDSRSDILQEVGLVGIFQANPKENHVLALKRIFRYLQGNVDYGLWYPKDMYLILKDYTNADWA